MHELSIAEELVRMIRQELRAHPEARLKTAHICLGALRLVERTTLEFCFEAIIRDTELTGAQLCIEPVEAAARCKQCGLEFAVEDRWFECPRCAATNSELLRGDELQLTSLDIEAVTTGAGTGTKESHICLPADKLSNGG
jgi:hydrogenase nickel incorporation protein HypA/HybF